MLNVGSILLKLFSKLSSKLRENTLGGLAGYSAKVSQNVYLQVFLI